MKRFLVFAHLKSSHKDAFADIARCVQSFSKAPCSLLYAAPGKDALMIFVETAKPAPVVRAALEGLMTTTNCDTFFVMEVGQEFSAVGGSAAWTWLQHHGVQKKVG